MRLREWISRIRVWEQGNGYGMGWDSTGDEL